MVDQSWETLEEWVARFLFRLWFALWSLFLGVFLPYVPTPTGERIQNIFWGTFYGLGLFLTDSLFINSIASRFLVFGMVVWPAFLTGFLFWASGYIWTRGRAAAFAAGFALLFSSIIVIGMSQLRYEPFNRLP